MNEDFRSTPQEVEHLLKQIAETKDALREISARVANIERHVKRAFSVAEQPRQKQSRRSPAPSQPTLTAEGARQLFEELRAIFKDSGRDGVAPRLSKIELADLKFLVQELGAPLPNKPSRPSLLSAILSRLNESVMLSRNQNVTTPNGSTL